MAKLLPLKIKTSQRWLCAAVTLCLWGQFSVAAAQALSVEALVKDLRSHYPPLEQARLKRQITEAKLLEKQGAFDTKVKSKLGAYPLGYYQNLQLDSVIEQATPWWGTTFFTGYRLGAGSFADYDGKKETLSLGEIRAGLEVPLLRNRELDSRRTDLRALELQLQIADLEIFEKQLKFTKDALKSYWSWVAAQQKREIYAQLLQLAEIRTGQLQIQINLGKKAPIEALENQRALLKRQNKLLEQIQELQQEALELGLFLGPDQNLNPAQTSAFPSGNNCQSPVKPERVPKALLQRPEALRLALQAQQNQLGQDLARNQTLPDLGLYLVFSQDLGTGSKTKAPFEAQTGLNLEWPIQMRKAQGQLLQLEVEGQQLALEQAFLARQIRNQIQGVEISLQTACQQIVLARQELTVATQVALAEMERFELGGTTLYIVNKREQEAAESRLRLVEAQKDYFVAESQYYLVQGLLPTGSSPN